jgi:RNA polymerase sigma-70 factor (ECF subfamily)
MLYSPSRPSLRAETEFLMSATPASLLMRLRQPSDHDAWERFVQLYTPLLFHWASKWEVQPSDAADLVQEVFVNLLQSLPAFEYDSHRSFRAWLHTVVRNKWLDLRRRRGQLPANDNGLSGVAASGPLAEFDEAEFRSLLVQRALQLIEKDFTPPTVAAFRATALESRAACDVASELGLTENAVYLARNRILRRLRAELEGMWE